MPTTPLLLLLHFASPKPYLLALALCASVGPPVWVISVDPMVKELAASLVMSRPTGALVPGCLPTQAVAP
jgi:hypothetical protein